MNEQWKNETVALAEQVGFAELGARYFRHTCEVWSWGAQIYRERDAYDTDAEWNEALDDVMVLSEQCDRMFTAIWPTMPRL